MLECNASAMWATKVLFSHQVKLLSLMKRDIPYQSRLVKQREGGVMTIRQTYQKFVD